MDVHATDDISNRFSKLHVEVFEVGNNEWTETILSNFIGLYSSLKPRPPYELLSSDIRRCRLTSQSKMSRRCRPMSPDIAVTFLTVRQATIETVPCRTVLVTLGTHVARQMFLVETRFNCDLYTTIYIYSYCLFFLLCAKLRKDFKLYIHNWS